MPLRGRLIVQVVFQCRARRQGAPLPRLLSRKVYHGGLSANGASAEGQLQEFIAASVPIEHVVPRLDLVNVFHDHGSRQKQWWTLHIPASKMDKKVLFQII